MALSLSENHHGESECFIPDLSYQFTPKLWKPEVTGDFKNAFQATVVKIFGEVTSLSFSVSKLLS